MRTHAARFLAGASDPRALPSPAGPEVAFVGRSNVGKSSLLNALVGQRGLARVSKRPGRTQQINFFVVDERVVFVDLPGYGFARVPQDVKEGWKALVEGYLTDRAALRAAVVLIDARRGLLSDDAQLLSYLGEIGVPGVVVLTKIDKLKRNDRARQIRAIRLALPAVATIPCSSASGEGVADLWDVIEEAAG